MKIGAMRHRITIEKKLPGISENGFSEKTSEIVGTAWSEVKQISGRESEKAGATQTEVRYLFRIRYLPGIDTTMEILFQEVHYQIVSIDYLRYEKRYVEILAERVAQSG